MLITSLKHSFPISLICPRGPISQKILYISLQIFIFQCLRFFFYVILCSLLESKRLLISYEIYFFILMEKGNVVWMYELCISLEAKSFFSKLFGWTEWGCVTWTLFYYFAFCFNISSYQLLKLSAPVHQEVWAELYCCLYLPIQTFLFSCKKLYFLLFV